MAKAIDVANFFIDLVNKVEDEPMTNLRINKMLYFAQAYSLVRLGKRLFPEDIQAWQYGPVVKTIYDKFKKGMSSPIQSVSGEYSSDVFSDEEIALLLDVEREFGRFTTSALCGITHQEGSPWKEVYRPDASEVVIPIERMRDYFSQRPLPEFQLSYSSADVIGFHDEEGHLVLPKEDDDDDSSSE